MDFIFHIIATLFCLLRLNAMGSSGVVLFGTPAAAEVHAEFQQFVFFAECVARVPVALWGSGGRGVDA